MWAPCVAPAVPTWPVWKAKRGETTRTKGGEEGKSYPKVISRSMSGLAAAADAIWVLGCSRGQG